MRTIPYNDIVTAVRAMCMEAACVLPSDVLARIREARAAEPFPRAQLILDSVIENAEIASVRRIPICQDTGTAVFFVELGEAARVEGGGLIDAINEGVRRGYTDGNLRPSVVDDPVFDRVNTGGNTPAVVHVNLALGDRLSISLLPKGGGCENMSALAMLKPSDGSAGVAKFVCNAVVSAGGNPCPPLVVGVGVGGTADAACALAKKALLRPLGEHNADGRYAQLERYLIKEINASGVGPQGLGGMSTALWVAVEYMPCHIASMPVAVCINCHAARKASVEI
jgi:fumarate hydratase subunit alpha